MALEVLQQMHLVGDSQPWTPPPWRAVDDTVHGGLSYSFLTVTRFDQPFSNEQATFFGVLDTSRPPHVHSSPPHPPHSSPPRPHPHSHIDPPVEHHEHEGLKVPNPVQAAAHYYHDGESFASQRTKTLAAWTDLTAWDGLFLAVAQTDGQIYSVALRDDFSLLDPAGLTAAPDAPSSPDSPYLPDEPNAPDSNDDDPKGGSGAGSGTGSGAGQGVGEDGKEGVTGEKGEGGVGGAGYYDDAGASYDYGAGGAVDAAEAGIRYEANFSLPPTDVGGRVRLGWEGFVPMRGGRRVEGARGLDRSRITELSLMVRSYFGQQHGNFSLTLNSIAVYKIQMEDGALPRRRRRSLASLVQDGIEWVRDQLQ